VTSELTVVDEADFGAARPDAGWMGGQFILTYRTCCEVRAAAHPLSLRELHSESSSVCVCVCVLACAGRWSSRLAARRGNGAARERRMSMASPARRRVRHRGGAAGATYAGGCACAEARSTQCRRTRWPSSGPSPKSRPAARMRARLFAAHANARSAATAGVWARGLRVVPGVVGAAGRRLTTERASLFCRGADGRRECRLHQQPPSV